MNRRKERRDPDYPELLKESPIEAKTQESQEEMWMDVCVDTYAVEIIGVSKVITKLKEKFILTRRNP